MDGSASTSRSPALKDHGTNLTPPYITIVILITGVVGGLVLVISVLLFCKYCIKQKKVLKRQPALFSRYGTESSYRQYSHYESLDSTSCVDPYQRDPSDSTSQQRVALLRPQQDDKDTREPVDEESSIDYVVAKYKESLKADERERTRRESQGERRTSCTSSSKAEAACFGRRDSKRRVSFAVLNRRTTRRAASRRRRYTEGDFHHLKTLRVDHPDRPGRVVKQRSIGIDRLQVATREQRHDAFRRRSVSDDPRMHPLEPGQGLSPSPPEEDLFPVTSAPILAQHYDEDILPFGYRYQRTEVSVEVHREPSNGSGSVSSRGDVASGSRTASPPKLLETASRASSRTRHSISLETVSPTERLAVSLEKRRVKSCESELHEYDRLEITQFHRGPFYNADYDVMSEGGSPELRSKVRYNDTGSFEEVNEEHMHILDVVSSIEDVTMDDDDDTETLNGAQKYRELWNLRATFEEEEDFSDTIRMEDLTSPDEQSPEEQEQATTSELTTSFESNTDPVAEQDEGHDHGEGECEGNNCPPQRRKSSSTLLIPQLSYESRRQNYRGILTRRGKKIEMPKANNDNSFDSIETDGEVSEDTSRHEVTTTSFESTTDNTDSTGEAQNPHKLQQMRGDSGYKSLETQNTVGSIDHQQSTATPPGPTPKPVKKQIQFTIDSEDLRETQEYSHLIDTADKPCATSPTEGGLLQRSPSQKKTLFERRTAKTASKKRREYGREKQTQYVYESMAHVEAETDSKSDQLSGDSFDDIGPPGSGKLSVFTRFFRSQKKRPMHRDFSIDEKTDALFQQFTRFDPHLEKHTLTVRRQSYPTRPRMHRRPTDPDPPTRRRDKLSLEVRSVSMDSDSTGSTDRRHSLAQDSIEEEYQQQQQPTEGQPHGGEAEGRNTQATRSPTLAMASSSSSSSTTRKESVIHDIPIIRLPDGDMPEIC